MNKCGEKLYAIYDSQEQCVCVGSSAVCSNFLGVTLGQFFCRVWYTKKEKVTGKRGGYTIYEIEGEEDGEV